MFLPWKVQLQKGNDKIAQHLTDIRSIFHFLIVDFKLGGIVIS
ncbi:hypothetical protein PPEP_b0572 [Pseudoalteromonas peptidolytica F12-50-A1]|uniref:Uncharacterized protein n=1 Tax=Pseudoalteromonas peptidolytica F12-50-A1 TaxID=1315280 RepID=A0A8I0N0K7_9GAMM|nr:hypothetical protein [Pseudoalteromonas peptidolytica F12-50-A1]